jgi:hypothetical protein
MKSKYWSVLVFAAIIAFFSVRRMKMAEVSAAEAVVLWGIFWLLFSAVISAVVWVCDRGTKEG